MLPPPSPRFYIVGAILSAFGALVLAWWNALRKKPDPHSKSLLAFAVLALAVGVAITSLAVWVDLGRQVELNTTVLWYTVSVQTNASGPVRLILPAPSDARFFAALNATNGSSSLRLNHTASDTNAVLTAYGNVSFQIRASVATIVGNWSFTRVAYPGAWVGGPATNATIELWDGEKNATVVLSLDVSISWQCATHSLRLESTVHQGIASYPAEDLTSTC